VTLASDFDYPLPASAIAQKPLARRSHCRLAVVERAAGRVSHARFDQLGQWLRPGDLLVLNDSRVLPARIPCQRGTGGAVEVFLLDALRSHGPYTAMLKPAAKLRVGEPLTPLREPAGRFRLVQRLPNGNCTVSWDGPAMDEALLQRLGLPPLPPYIGRERLPSEGQARRDQAAYQTVYAQGPGSVAAPTAGLHFSRGLLKALRAQGVRTASVTLHVGAGTFLPVKTERLDQHDIHSEACVVPSATATAIETARTEGRRVIAVGTTALRALESAALPGGGFHQGWMDTRLFILPGYSFKVVDGLLTNFHQPRSTLLPLVAAFWERQGVLDLYQDCLHLGYRFLSYGDACLFL
jgi:S-adenosylmethionine:tRNA ribosyltransferase-isomerase